MDFRTESVDDLAARVASGELSARQLTEHALGRIEALNGRLNAFVALDPEGAMAEATAVDDAVAAGREVGPLAGIPIGVKDNEHATGFVTTFGSLSYASDPPADRDSTLVERLRGAGCVVLGKTNLPEFGWKADTDNLVFGSTRNPWNEERSAGGSSGGSAAAVAAGMVPLATGSDGGGSLRIPSAVCGLTGFKPSLGRIPSAGDPPGWPLLSTSGPMAMRARDLAYVLDCVVGPEPGDLRSLPMPEASWSRSLKDLHLPARVAWSPTLGYAPVDSQIREICEEALRALENEGVEVVQVDDVFEEDPIGPYLALTNAYNLRSLGHLRGSEAWDRVDPGLRAGLEWAATSLSVVDLVEAEDACHRLNHRLVRSLGRAPLLLTPTVAGRTPVVGQPGLVDGSPEANWVRFTYPFNLTRSPAGSVCAGFTSEGLPVGLQVVGPSHGDVVVLRMLAALEDLLDLDTVARIG
jgi:aspartyl-tRNA(Asn)/glutamyl-tRNA(Gln) amidotransferase subunit A